MKCTCNHFDVPTGGICHRCGKKVLRTSTGHEIDPPESGVPTTIVPLSKRNYSPYRRMDAEGWLRDGWGDFQLVDSVTRGSFSTGNILVADRHLYTIECRPATSGCWGKSVVYRAVRRREI